MTANTVDIRETLASYQTVLDAEINDYSETLLQRVADEYTPYSHEAVSAYVTILRRGGKRLRGALAMTGYRMAGGQDEQLAHRLGLVLELIHAYLLIMDDVADRSELRRGGPSAHKIIETRHRNKKWHGDSVHFGESIASHVGLLGGHLAMQELCALPADDNAKLEAVSLLNDIIFRTAHGQFNDMYHEVTGVMDEQSVLDALRWKTAGYTITGPLQLGAILAGADAADSRALEPFGDTLGLAFQITDDILGTFSQTQETGKSNRDDMREGKITLLVARALARGNQEQKAAIRAALGNLNADDAEFEAFRGAIEDSGALQYARDKVDDLVRRSVASLDELPLSWQEQKEWQFLRQLARYIQNRSA